MRFRTRVVAEKIYGAIGMVNKLIENMDVEGDGFSEFKSRLISHSL